MLTSIVASFLVILAYSPAFADGGRRAAPKKICEFDLGPYTTGRVAKDMLRAVDSSLTERLSERVYRDATEPDMLLLENIDPVLSFDHETRTAMDFARFLRKFRGQYFLFVSSIAGRSLPSFDGLVLDGRLSPLANVSLKHISSKTADATVELLRENLRNRLQKSDSPESLASPSDWFRRANSLPHPEGDQFHPKEYKKQLERAAFSASLLNLFGGGREMSTVIDMRDSGYNFEMFHHEEAQQIVIRLMNEDSHGHHSLILLWDATHVIEFGPHRALIYGHGADGQQ